MAYSYNKHTQVVEHIDTNMSLTKLLGIFDDNGNEVTRYLSATALLELSASTSVIDSRIESYISNDIDADGNVPNKTVSPKETKRYVDSKVQIAKEDIIGESTDPASADTIKGVKNALAAETTAREDADNALGTRIDGVIGSSTGSGTEDATIYDLRRGLDNEIRNRSNGDSELNDKLERWTARSEFYGQRVVLLRCEDQNGELVVTEEAFLTDLNNLINGRQPIKYFNQLSFRSKYGGTDSNIAQALTKVIGSLGSVLIGYKIKLYNDDNPDSIDAWIELGVDLRGISVIGHYGSESILSVTVADTPLLLGWGISPSLNSLSDSIRTELSTLIGNETTARQNADNALGTRIDNVIGSSTGSSTSEATIWDLRRSLEAEITNRSNADDELKGDPSARTLSNPTIYDTRRLISALTDPFDRGIYQYPSNIISWTGQSWDFNYSPNAVYAVFVDTTNFIVADSNFDILCANPYMLSALLGGGVAAGLPTVTETTTLSQVVAHLQPASRLNVHMYLAAFRGLYRSNEVPDPTHQGIDSIVSIRLAYAGNYGSAPYRWCHIIARVKLYNTSDLSKTVIETAADKLPRSVELRVTPSDLANYKAVYFKLKIVSIISISTAIE